MKDVFISHAGEDAALALAIAKGLEDAGYTTWHYHRDPVPGPSHHAQENEAIRGSKVFLLIVSTSSLESGEVHSEVMCAKRNSKPFIPIYSNIRHSVVKDHRRGGEWIFVMDSATAVKLDDEDVAAILPKVVAGLNELGIQPGHENSPPIPTPCHLPHLDSIVSLPPELATEQLDLQAAPSFLPNNACCVQRSKREEHLDTLFDKLKNHTDLLVLSGAQLTGKTWLANQVVDRYQQEEPDLQIHTVAVRLENVRPHIKEYAKSQRSSRGKVQSVPENLIYALWAIGLMGELFYNLDRKLKGEIEIDPTRNQRLPYIKDCALVIGELDAKSHANPSRSRLAILAETILEVLTSIGLHNAKMLLVLDIEDLHTYPSVHPVRQIGDSMMNSFADTLNKAIAEPRFVTSTSAQNWLKIIVTTQQLELHPARKGWKHPMVDLGFFDISDCQEFANASLTERFDANEREDLTRHAFEFTRGYPWFFHRWMRAGCFLRDNYPELTLDDLIGSVRGRGLFWYYSDVLSGKFYELLEDSAATDFPQANADESRFLSSVRDVFQRNRSLLDLYETLVTDHAKSAYARNEQGGDILLLTRLGLVTFDKAQDRFKYANPAIETFFNPSRMRAFLNMRTPMLAAIRGTR